jgi:hypothetical protein
MSSDFRNPYVRIASQYAPATEEVPETRYRAMSGLAIASLSLGLLSALTAVSWAFVLIPLAGGLLGWLALRRIRRNPEEMTGVRVAWAGIVTSLLLWACGAAWTTYTTYFGVPEGYKPIDYAMLQPDQNNPEERVSQEAEMLHDQKVFLRGYMNPGKQKSGIKEFFLIDDPGACSFCSVTPVPTQLIRVKLTGSMKLNYTTRLIGVGGAFTVHKDPREEGFRELVYQIDADCIR